MAEDKQFRKVIREEFGKVGDSIKSGIKDMGSMVSSSMSEIVGPTISRMAGTVVNMGKNLTSSLFGLFKRPEESPSDKVRNSLLQNIVEHFRREEKRLAREIPEEKRTFGDKLLLGIVVGLGLLIGGIARKFVLPFELLYKVLKPFFRFFGWVGKLIGKIPGISALITKGEGALAWFGKILGKLAGSKGLLGTFFRSVATGFKILGWPLTIFMGLIDFVRGFIKTEGTLVDKIKAGLLGAITGFIELPIRLVGWIADWVFKLFGAKVEGGIANLILGKITGMFTTLFDGVVSLVSSILDGSIIGKITTVLSSLLQTFKSFFMKPITFLRGLIDSEMSLVDRIKESLAGAITGLIQLPSKIMGQIVGWISGIFSDDMGATITKRVSDTFTLIFDKVISFMSSLGSIVTAIIEKVKSTVAKIPFIGGLASIFGKKDVTPITPTTTAPTTQVESIKSERIAAAKAKEIKKGEERKELEKERRKSQEEQKKVSEQQTNIMTQIVAQQSPPPTEIPSEVDNHLLGLGVMGLA